MHLRKFLESNCVAVYVLNSEEHVNTITIVINCRLIKMSVNGMTTHCSVQKSGDFGTRILDYHIHLVKMKTFTLLTWWVKSMFLSVLVSQEMRSMVYQVHMCAFYSEETHKSRFMATDHQFKWNMHNIYVFFP